MNPDPPVTKAAALIWAMLVRAGVGQAHSGRVFDRYAIQTSTTRLRP